jgi:proton glutamate symport protein
VAVEGARELGTMKLGGRSSGHVSRTVAALAALAAGIALGIALHGSRDPGVDRLVSSVALIGQLWVAAIRMTVIPLVITLTLAAIVGMSGDNSIGTLGVRTVLLFIGMHVAVGLVTLAVAAPIVSLYPADAETASFLGARTPAPPAVPVPGRLDPASLGDRLKALPANIFQAVAAGEILPILLITVFFALAVTRLPPERRDPLKTVFQGLADAMLVLIGWILRILPLGVFALCLEFAFRVGARVTGVLAAWVVLVSGLLLLATLLLYPATAILGRTSLSRFARAVAPAQLVAVSTRSSLASLPALVKGGQTHLALPASATGLVLPLSVTTFKLNRGVSSIAELLFLAHVFHVPLGPSLVAEFFAIQIILSFSTAGIPSLGNVRSIPAYVAIGIPIEAILILNAVETIPDIFKTLINVTGDMSAATILSRRERAEPTGVASIPREARRR